MSSTPPPTTSGFSPFDDPHVDPHFSAPPPEPGSRRPPRHIPDFDFNVAKLCGPRPLADTFAAGVNWLWPGRVPLGKLTLLVGDPGVGKSLLALDIAARVTSNQPWPDAPSPPDHPASRIEHPASPFDHPASQVLILSAEDDPADTLRPRLAAMGADLTRIVANPWETQITGPHAEFRRRCLSGLRPELDLSESLVPLARWLEALPDIRLIVLDPLSAFLGRNIEHIGSEVRRLLTPLAGLAARRNLAIVAIAHLRKAGGAALHRAAGSLAFMAIARAGCLVVRDPTDETRRLFLPIKNNLAAPSAALGFTIGAADGPAGAPTDQPQIHWTTDVDPIAVEQALRPGASRPRLPSPELDDAVRWLRQQLAAGVQPSAHIECLAVGHGLSVMTVRRAFRRLGGEAVRTGFGATGMWHWRLPGIGGQEPNPDPDHLWDEMPRNAG